MAKLRASRSEIMSNARLKLYPSACCLQVSNAIIFREPGWEPCKRSYDVPPKGKGSDPERSMLVSRARAKSAVRDIALLNSFGFFFTWTLDPKKINRHDADEVKRAVMNCLKNLVKRKAFPMSSFRSFTRTARFTFMVCATWEVCALNVP